MARTNKTGIDYFPLDVDLFADDKVQLIEAEFGIKGGYIIVRLLCKIYREGYFYQWGGDECLLFTKNLGAEFVPSMVNEVINGLVRRCFFDKGCFDRFGILTSKGIQNRYFEAAKRYNQIDVIKDYLLVDVSKFNNVNIIAINVNINSINDDINSQKKRKEKKEKENKLKEDFEIFRKKYKGTKKGLETELENFKKKHKNWENIIPLLTPALEEMEKWRTEAAAHGVFVPNYADLSTWLNQSRWTTEFNFNFKNNGNSNKKPIADPTRISREGFGSLRRD